MQEPNPDDSIMEFFNTKMDKPYRWSDELIMV